MRAQTWAVATMCIAVGVVIAAVASLTAGQGQSTSNPASQPATTRAVAEGEEGFEVRVTSEIRVRFGIGATRVTKRILAETFAAPARVSQDPRAAVRISTVVSGRIVEANVRVGDQVKHGQVLAVLDSPELGNVQNDYREKKGLADAAKENLDPLKSLWDRAKAADPGHGIDFATALRREAEYVAGKARARDCDIAAKVAADRLRLLGMSDEAIAALVKSEHPDTRQALFSPIDGCVVECGLTVGQFLTPDEDKLLVVADASRVLITAEVTAARAGQIAAGSDATIDVAGKSFVARAAAVLPAVDPSTQMARVRLEVSGAPPSLRPGSFATVHLTQSAAHPPASVLAIPRGAVQVLQGKTLVFVPAPDEPDTFVVRFVAVGPAVDEWVPVLSGLKEGESVASSGTFILKAEMSKGPAAD